MENRLVQRQLGFSAATAASNIHDQYTRVLIARTRGKQGPNLIAADSVHFRIFQQALVAIQRVTKEGKSAQMGFPSLAFAGAGYELDVVLEGGIGSAMPANTTYFLKVGDDGLRFRYHPIATSSPSAASCARSTRTRLFSTSVSTET
jgi:hypothetical protein